MMRPFLGGLLLLLLLSGPVDPALAGMELNGVLATENYVGVRKGEFFDFRNANWFQLKVAADPHEQVSVTTNLELRNTNFTQVRTVDELWDRSTLEPVSWRINQAYMDIYGFLFDGDYAVLDLRVGKQQLAWGEADGFNPTNKFDPLNLECPHDFKESLGNVSLKAVLNVGDELFSVEGVVVPRFLPSVLPVDLFIGDDKLNNPLMPSIGEDIMAFPELLIREPGYEALRTTTPEAVVGNVMAGARIRWSVWGFDWSISYAHARETIPVPRRVNAVFESFVLPGQDDCPDDVDLCTRIDIDDVELIYPQVDVLGLNLRGSIWDIGVWGEAALIFPQRVDTKIEAPGFEIDIKAIEDEPYTKWVVGAEYTFPGGYYFNLQWVHGFFVEMTGHRLHDYLFLVFRKSVLSDRLRFEVSLGGELDTTLGRRAVGGLGNVTVSYKPYDGSEIVLGYMMARGESGTAFEIFEELDQAYLKFRADF